MFGLLNSSQIYGLQQVHEHHSKTASLPYKTSISSSASSNNKQRRSASNVSATAHGKETSKLFASFSSMQNNIKSPTNFIEKFLKNELLNGYDTLRNYKNFHQSNTNCNNQQTNSGNASPFSNSSSRHSTGSSYHSFHPEGILNTFNCLQGSYRSSCDGEFYEAVNVLKQTEKTASGNNNEMTIKCSKNLLAEPATVQSPATLQNYQKLPDYDLDMPLELVTASSGASSGEFNSDVTLSSTNTSSSNGSSSYKKLLFGSRSTKNLDVSNQHTQQQQHLQANEVASDNSSTSPCNSTSLTLKTTDLQRSSSGSSAASNRVESTPIVNANMSKTMTPERAQRRKLLQMISNYEQQQKLLQRELAKEKRRRTEELACVVKSLICFESKLKTDMKTVNARLQEKDAEICRLVQLNRALKKQLEKWQQAQLDNICDEGVVMEQQQEQQLLLTDDCLMLEALQCINCRKQFYDIEAKVESWTQLKMEQPDKNAENRSNDEPTTEVGSSSDDTLSSSFYGARRSQRYTSKRHSGTFRDYMRSRAMHIDDAALEQQHSEQEQHSSSSLSRDDSQHSYETLHVYSRNIERMHGIKATAVEDDDGIFSPTQDEDFEEDSQQQPPIDRSLQIVKRRSTEFSEASPKQVYETSTDDWYASASDQEEIGSSNANKSYAHGAVNPVLECVNQILLQQSLEETLHEQSGVGDASLLGENSMHKTITNANLPRRSSLSGRRGAKTTNCGNNSQLQTNSRKRVHFSTKNSMVHVPRHDEQDDDNVDDDMEVAAVQLRQHNKLISQYQPLNYFSPATTTTDNCTATAATTTTRNALTEQDVLNYESIYSNEYEPIGSEQNSSHSNLYVDMESNAKLSKICKMPPALPPKPANLLKFKKSLQQLDEVPDEHDSGNELDNQTSAVHHNNQSCSNQSVLSEPDYCSISELNVCATSVQVVADVHKAQTESEPDLDAQSSMSELQLEVSTVASDDTCAAAASQKTDEIEEIFADIPKLPNVAAIIAPKKQAMAIAEQQNDYLLMSGSSYFNASGSKSNMALKLQLNLSNSASTTPYKRKHVPNILAEISKRMSQPNSPTTPTKPNISPVGKAKTVTGNNNNILKSLENSPTDLPLQAEFDWYNLDAEYGKSNSSSSNDALNKMNGSACKHLPEIDESHENIVHAADEYNLDEEFSLCSDKTDVSSDNATTAVPTVQLVVDPLPLLNLNAVSKVQQNNQLNAVLCEAINFPLFAENSPLVLTNGNGAVGAGGVNVKAKKIKKNLANFEKFIEGSGLSQKPLPSKRKIYFAGPFV